MKITKRQLKRIIREEKSRILNEQAGDEAVRFEEIMGELHELIEEAFDLCGRDRGAEGYWYNTMTGCIDGRATMINMEQTLEEMGGAGAEDMMELGYMDGLNGVEPQHPDNEYYMINWKDGKNEQ